MVEEMSVFATTSRIFENVRVSKITRHELQNSSVSKLMRASSELFRLLDRTDAVQVEVSRRLWVLRSTVLFTLLPFADPALALCQQLNELDRESSGLSEAKSSLEMLRTAVMELVNSSRNPKSDWLFGYKSSNDISRNGKTGLLRGLSGG